MKIVNIEEIEKILLKNKAIFSEGEERASEEYGEDETGKICYLSGYYKKLLSMLFDELL